MQLHPDVQALLDAIRALQHHLEQFDEHWGASVRKAADEIANSDAHGLQRFLGLFGGMGSLNDLVLERDGKPLGWENVRLAALKRKAWEMGQDLKQEMG
jgi:hypothetical protein